MVSGARQPYVRNSRHEALRASRLLTAATGFPVRAMGVVVLVGAEEVVTKQSPSDVHVMTRRGLRRWLARHPAVIDSTAVDAMFEQARRSTTWTA